MHHPAVAVHAQQVLHTAGARTADPGDVVTSQVHEHDVLGDLLGVGAQLQLQAGVSLVVHRAVGVQPARPGPSDGADGDPATAHRVQQRRLRGSAEELEVRGGQVEHVGAGIGVAQHVVGGQRIGAVNGEAARGHHLVDVTVGDVAAHLLHDRLEVGVGDGGHRVQDGGAGGDDATGRCRCLNGCVGGCVGGCFCAVGWVLDPVDGGGQRLHAPLQVGGVDRGPHQGRLLGGVVDDQDDAGVVEEVVGAGVGALGHLGQGLEGGQIVEGEGPRLQRQVGVVDLGPSQKTQRLDRGQGGEPLALLDGRVVVGAGGQGQSQPAGAAVGDVLGQPRLKTRQSRQTIGPGARSVDGVQRLRHHGPAPARQPGRGLQDGDRGARGLRGDVGALQQDTVHRAHGALVGRVHSGAQQTGVRQLLQQGAAVGVVAH